MAFPSTDGVPEHRWRSRASLAFRTPLSFRAQRGISSRGNVCPHRFFTPLLTVQNGVARFNYPLTYSVSVMTFNPPWAPVAVSGA